MYKTEQEKFWAGEFGDEYSERNRGAHIVASKTALYSRLCAHLTVTSVLELGCNIGLNLQALRWLLPSASLTGVEINEKAAAKARDIPNVQIHHGSIFEFKPDRVWDLVFTSGVLIHINPDELPRVYDLMYKASGRYIAMIEYYNPKPVEVNYRGHSGKLFKRDFAGEFMDAHPDVRLVNYGFLYHRDPVFPDDDSTWFLMEKSRPLTSANP